jgi:hypothetical protein
MGFSKKFDKNQFFLFYRTQVHILRISAVDEGMEPGLVQNQPEKSAISPRGREPPKALQAR